MPAESTGPATTAGRLVIDAGSAARSPATGRWQDRGDLVDVVVDGSGKSHNKTMKTMTGTVVDLDGCIGQRPPPRLENRMHTTFVLLQIYSLNIEFYQLQATNTKTGRPAQWALATWAPEGPVSSA